MRELNENIVRILEDNGFYVGEPEYSDHHNEYCIEINQSTDLGEDWWFALYFDGSDEDFIQKFETMVDNFDPDEEAKEYIKLCGTHGVPDSPRDIIADQDWKLETLKATLEDLNKEFEDYPDTDDEDEEYTITLKLTDNGKTVWASSNEDPIGEESTFKTITDRGEQMLIALATYLGYEPSMVLNLEGIEEEEEATGDTEPWKVFYYGLKELGAYTIFGEGGGEEQATKELLASELKVKPSDIEVKIEMR